MCFAGQPLPICTFQAFFYLSSEQKFNDFIFFIKVKSSSWKKKLFKTQIYITVKSGQAHGTLCAL